MAVAEQILYCSNTELVRAECIGFDAFETTNPRSVFDDQFDGVGTQRTFYRPSLKDAAKQRIYTWSSPLELYTHETRSPTGGESKAAHAKWVRFAPPDHQQQ
jgi:hypothetical protein